MSTSKKRNARGEEVADATKFADYSKYHNSPSLSDVTIHYSGRVFHGHKVILANGALWFENAFKNNNWRESKAKEITLEEDDPEALEGMFKYIYNIDPETPTKYGVVDGAIFTIELFRVADKYQCEALLNAAPGMFHDRLKKVLYKMSEEWVRHHREDRSRECTEEERSAVSADMLIQVAGAVYELQDCWAGKDKSPITEDLLTTMFKHHEIDPLWEGGSQGTALKIAAEQVPQFGSDLFIELMKRRACGRENEVKAGWTRCWRETCPKCKKTYTTINYLSDYCHMCGSKRRG